jgi:hypothetical protein
MASSSSMSLTLIVLTATCPTDISGRNFQDNIIRTSVEVAGSMDIEHFQISPKPPDAVG